ncbi:MAG TPA: mechanosensitive ion channel family protein [Candidatus Acidoferrales bacterium]|jgi:small-conductance mechanosensitive channel|nr:mechanosensitive ion channel family protein [Candidatus Acidoferrales bacterium]
MARRSLLSIPLLTALLCAVCLGALRAQTLPTIPLPTLVPAATLPGGVRQDGLFNTAPISIDGVQVFRIAVPANVGSDQISIEMRQQSIEAAIAQVLAPQTGAQGSDTIYNPESLSIAVHGTGEVAQLFATDADHPDPLSLLTVTSADAKYQKLPVATLAEAWRAKLEAGLTAALEKRQPAVVKANVADLLRSFGILIVVSLVLWFVLWFLRKKRIELRASITKSRRELDAAEASQNPEHPSATSQRLRFMGLAIRASGPEMKLRALKALSGVLGWGLLLAWFLTIVWALSLFPETTQFSHTLRRRAFWIVVIVVGAFVLVRIVDLAISQVARMYGERARVREAGEARARLLLRIPTLARAIAGFATMIIVFIAVLGGIGALGGTNNTLLTFGGIAALGITFAAQNLLRDLLNGVFVLIEDQYVVGDYVIVDQFSGVVEHMSLRAVQLRDASGSLITIPHGQVTQVVNCSRNWSRVDYRVPVDARADIAAAIGIVRTILEALAAEERFGGWMLDPVEFIGVDSMSATGVVLRASIKTAPLRQFELKREINARVLKGLDEAGIALGLDPKAAASLSVNLGPS